MRARGAAGAAGRSVAAVGVALLLGAVPSAGRANAAADSLVTTAGASATTAGATAGATGGATGAATGAAASAATGVLSPPRLGGYLQARETAQEELGVAALLNRARLSLDGSLPSRFAYRFLVETEASAGARNPATVSLREATIKWSPAPFALVAGEFKVRPRSDEGMYRLGVEVSQDAGHEIVDAVR